MQAVTRLVRLTAGLEEALANETIGLMLWHAKQLAGP